MTDISKCENMTCPLKERCYRFTCIPNPHWQSYTKFEWEYVNNKPHCDYFIDNKK